MTQTINELYFSKYSIIYISACAGDTWGGFLPGDPRPSPQSRDIQPPVSEGGAERDNQITMIEIWGITLS